jgi:hypothetical protein
MRDSLSIECGQTERDDSSNRTVLRRTVQFQERQERKGEGETGDVVRETSERSWEGFLMTG